MKVFQPDGVIDMDTQKVTAEYRMAYWAQTLQERNASGESITDFCQNRGISRNTYFYWQRKLRAAACTELSTRNSDVGNDLVPNGWARLSAPAKDGALTIEVGGCRITVNGETDPELLVKVVRTLNSL